MNNTVVGYDLKTYIDNLFILLHIYLFRKSYRKYYKYQIIKISFVYYSSIPKYWTFFLGEIKEDKLIS